MCKCPNCGTVFNPNEQMTLGEVIFFLDNREPDTKFKPAFGVAGSYRGHNEQVAFTPLEESTAVEMLVHAKAALGAMYYGYIGGKYVMDDDTLCNIAEHGRCSVWGDDVDHITLDKLESMLAHK